jgi:hypothetical protein
LGALLFHTDLLTALSNSRGEVRSRETREKRKRNARRRETIALLRASKKGRENLEIRGRNELGAIYERTLRSDAEGLVSASFYLGGGSDHSKFFNRCQAIHILFTPTIFPPCQRLESRNGVNLRQANFGSLFSFSA